ncbi:MAG: hypothetical protein LBQ47_00995, partial [Endomicrobium sp.]|nr:hypothetical protein [Endomicrobium sp.]
EKRMNFTDEERRNTLLSLTEDVAEKDKNYIYKILEYGRIKGTGERRLYVGGKIVDYSQLSKGMSANDKRIIVRGFITAIKKATEAEYIEDIDVISLVRMWQMDIDYDAMSIEEIKNYIFESLPEELRNIEFEAYIFKDGGDFEANINNQYAAQNEQIQKIIDAVIDYNLEYLNSDRLNPETITMEGVGAILNSLEDRSYSEADYTEKYGAYELQRAVEFLNEIAPNAKIGYMNDIYNRKGSKGNSKEKSVSGDTQAELAEKNEKYSQARQIAGQQGEFDLDQTAKPLYEAKKGDNGAEVVLTNAKSSLSEQKGYALLGDALTGAAQIRSHDDIGYLFKNLESAATENVFVVLMQADGSYSVLYVSSGSTSRSAIDFKHIIAAINEKKPARVCMVHNHPAGTLAASKGDIMVHETLSKNAKLLGFELMDSVIIDTDKGQYATFNESNAQALVGSTQRAPNQTITPKVERFDRTEYFKNSADFEEIKSSGDVAKLLTREKRGLKNKLHIIITSSALKVTKYVIAPDNLTAEELSKIIITEAADNGLNVILAYNNSELYNYDEINQISELLGSAGINLLACEFVKENEEIIEGYDNLAVKSKNAEMAVEEETETTTAAKSGNFENEPIKAFYSKNLKEAAEYFLSSYDDIIASIQNIDEANLTQEAKDLIALYESAKQNFDKQKLTADFEDYLTKNKITNKSLEPLYADMKRVMLSLWEDFKLSDQGWAGLNEEIVNVMEKQLKSEQFDSKLTTEDFKPLVDLLNRIKASDVKIGEADIDKALRLIKELKKRNIKLPDGQKLRKEILRRGIKGDTGNSLLDVGVIADEFSYKTVRRRDKKTGEVKTYQVKTGQIKVYQRGEEGYENAINLDNFVNEDNAADWLGKESGNEDAPQELADIFMKAVRGENVYKYDERELLEEYENIEKRKEEIFAMLGMGENTGKNDIKVLEKQLKVLKAYKLNRKKVLSRQAVKDIEQTIEKIKKEYAPKSKLKQAQKELEKLKQKLDKLESKEFKKLNNIKNYKSVEEIENALEYMLIDISVEAEFSADEQEAYKMAIPDRALKQIKESFVKALKADIGLLKKEANGELAQGEKKASLHQAMRLYGLLSDNPHITPSDIAAIMNKNKINSFADLAENAEKIFKDISAAIERNYKEYIAERIDNLVKIKDKYKRGSAYFAKFEKRDMDLWKELNRIMDLKQDEARKELEIIKAKDKETISKDEPSALDRQEILTLALNYKANGRRAGSPESFYEFYKKLLALIEAMRDGKSIYDTQSAAAVENDIREILAYMEKNPSIALERMYSYLIANFKGATLTAFGDALSNKFDITTEQIRENNFVAQKGEELFKRAGKIYGSERAFAKAHNDGDKKEYIYLTRLQNAIGNLIQVTLSKNNIIYIFTHIPDVSKIDAVENLLNSERDVSDKELLQASGNNKMLLRYMRQYGAQNLLDMWNKLSDADKQMSALYRAMAEETYNEVNKVFVQIYGYDLPRVEGGYFPSKPYSKAFSENFLSGYEPDSSPISKSFVKSRAGGSGVLMREDIDALEVLNRHFKQLANFIHLAPKLQHLQNVLLNQDVERAFSGNVISMAGLQDRLEEMKAVEIKDNIPKFNKVKELLNYILDNFDVLGNVTIKETNQTISVSKSNISDSLKRQRKQLNNKVYAKFKEAFENAVRVGFVEADEKHKDKNLGQEIFIAKIKIGKEIYFVEFKADVPLKDNDKGVLYYKAHKIITREQISELSKLYLNSRAKNNIAFDSKKVNKIKTDRSQEYATLLKFIKDFRNYNANVPYVLQTFNKVVGNLVISNLFSMFQLFKQAFTFGLMSKSMPKGDFIKYFIEGLLSPIDTIKFMWTNSVYLRNRYTNGQMNELLQMGGDYKTYKSAIEMLKKITSFPTRTGDLLANIIGGYAVVKYQMEQGKSKEEAFEIFAKTSSETMGSALTS